MKSTKRTSPFRFRRRDEIGASAAEEDAEFLSECFVDTGDLSLLMNTSDRHHIVLGRTGAGKTALLLKLAEDKPDQVIQISPENLALTYVSNSTIISFFGSIRVNLDPFFKLLWRHVFTVEILTRHVSERREPKQKSLFQWLRERFASDTPRDKEMKEAIDYLEKWGKSFWLETELRVKEITQKLETELGTGLRAQLGLGEANFEALVKAAKKLTQDERAELVYRAQKVISAAQVQDLQKVIRLLDTVLEDRQKSYYVVIDNLDENWVEERIRYKLIMALIVTARDFIKVKNAKIIVALRRDLIERVFRLTRESGFQEEKYRSLYLPLTWSNNALVEVLDTRVDALVTRRYTKQSVTHRDLLPKTYKKTPITEYIIDRVERPRDVISFFNCCIAEGTDRHRLDTKGFRAAEGEYSRSRLRALGDEWSANYPSLLDFVKILQQRPPSFEVSTIEDNHVNELCLSVAAEKPGGKGLLQQDAMKLVDCVFPAAQFKVLLMQAFYRIGLVGLKLEPHEAECWVDETGLSISSAEITESTTVVVHPMYHRALGIRV